VGRNKYNFIFITKNTNIHSFTKINSNLQLLLETCKVIKIDENLDFENLYKVLSLYSRKIASGEKEIRWHWSEKNYDEKGLKFHRSALPQSDWSPRLTRPCAYFK